MEKILVLGGTGAMGRYCVPHLFEKGYNVDVVSLDEMKSNTPGLRYTVGNAMDDDYIKELLKNNYDAVIDFMSYKLPQFKIRKDMFLSSTEQYVFLSSCRVYANEEIPVRETSPRLLNVSQDEEYLSYRETEYSLYKAIEEDLLRESGKNNYTIIRPATTYSTGRCQLVTLDIPVFGYRTLQGKKTLLPREAMDCEATLSWGGDVGRMIAELTLNPKALGEDFITSTSEHHTWREIAKMYNEIIGFEYEETDMETYLKCLAHGPYYPYHTAYYQLTKARMFTRITDNSKVLNTLGMTQSEIMPLYDGLKKELDGLTLEKIRPNEFINAQMDEYFRKQSI